MRLLEVLCFTFLCQYFVLATENPENVLVIEEQVEVASSIEIAVLKVKEKLRRVYEIDILKCKIIFAGFFLGKLIGINSRLDYLEKVLSIEVLNTIKNEFNAIKNRLDEMERANEELKSNGKSYIFYA